MQQHKTTALSFAGHLRVIRTVDDQKLRCAQSLHSGVLRVYTPFIFQQALESREQIDIDIIQTLTANNGFIIHETNSSDQGN